MRHRKSTKKFNRTKSHREAMFKNMLTSLIKNEKVYTTKEKGRELKALADKIIHKAKTDTVHSRRLVAKFVKDKEALTKLFEEVVIRYKNRTGGYVRRILAYKRFGDAAEMCYITLSDEILE